MKNDSKIIVIHDFIWYNFTINMQSLDKEEALIERIYEKHRYVYSYICCNNIAGAKHGSTGNGCTKHKL